jgi:hypothetical protein
MKKTIGFLFIATLISMNVKGQTGTDLEFSQTINQFVISGTSLGPIPTGKIWKIVGFSWQSTVASSSFTIQLDGPGTPSFPLRMYSSTNGNLDAALPLFFNEGDVLTCGGSSNFAAYLSIIEYTVIP